MNNLPKWRLTNPHPTLYDSESGTVVQQTAKVYKAMQNLINEYNQFVIELNKQFNNFKGETGVEIDQFKKCVTELIENYIKTVDSKLTQQDLLIAEITNKIGVSVIKQGTTSIYSEDDSKEVLDFECPDNTLIKFCVERSAAEQTHSDIDLGLIGISSFIDIPTSSLEKEAINVIKIESGKYRILISRVSPNGSKYKIYKIC